MALSIDVDLVCVDCGDTGKYIWAKGRCRICYERDLRRRKANGNVAPHSKARPDRGCNVCRDPEQKHYARGMCRSCYSHQQYQLMRDRRIEENVKTNAHKRTAPGTSNHLAQHGGGVGPEELGNPGPGEPETGDVPDEHTDLGRPVRHLVARPVEVMAVRWGPDWNGMLEAAQALGRLGFMFDIEYASPEDKRRGVDVFPELHIMDSRFRQHIVTQGLWIAIHPGFRQLRILTAEQLELEYEDRKTDSQ